MNFNDPRLPDRFWKKCTPKHDTGCWIWNAAALPSGYGRINMDGLVQSAHRVSYTALVGPIPDGMHIDHLVCQTPACCNPAHLEPVTPAENTRRGKAGATCRARQLAKTHCPSGHPYDHENTRIVGGKRHCRECGRMRARATHRLKNPFAKTRNRRRA
jgi:hypothetical protein